MRNALIIAGAIIIVGISGLIIMAPKPTPEQIQAQAAAAAAKAEQARALEQQRSEARIKELQATPPEVQAANIVSEKVDDAVGAYVGLKVLDILLR